MNGNGGGNKMRSNVTINILGGIKKEIDESAEFEELEQNP
jgi:hypothetical protein